MRKNRSISKTLLIILLFVFLILMTGGCLPTPPQPFTPWFKMIDVGYDINEPVWIDESSFIATCGFCDIFRKYSFNQDKTSTNLTGTYQFNQTDIGNLLNIAISPDANYAAMKVGYKGPGFDTNGELLNYRDIYLYKLNDNTFSNIAPGSANRSENHPTFIDNNTLFYFELDESVTNKVTQRIYKYLINSQTTTKIFEQTNDLFGAVIQGDNYWWLKAKPSINKLLTSSRHYNLADSTATYSFDIFDINGHIIQSGHEIISFDNGSNCDWTSVAACDWIDQNNIAIVGKKDGVYKIYKVNLVNKTTTIVFTAIDSVDTIQNIWGLSVSPNRQYCIAHVWTGFVNRLLIVKL